MSLHVRWGLEQAMRTMTDEQLGEAVREWVMEANHGGWDGWQGVGYRQARGAIQVLRDLKMWIEAYKK